KNGKECFREIWHVPDSLKTAAGITVCLGALASGLSRSAEVQAEQPSDVQQVVFDPTLADGIIMNHYVEQSAGYLPGTQSLYFDQFDRDDPAWDILNCFQQGTLPQNIADRCALVCSALNTEHPSLSLAALMWRVVNEPLFGTEGFSETEMKEVYATLEALRCRTSARRTLIFANRLDPYIRNGRITDPPFFMYSKAGARPGDVERYYLTADLNTERWGNANDTSGISAEYLLEHPYAEQMNLIFKTSDSAEIGTFGYEPLRVDSIGRYTVGVFDVIESAEDAVLLFEISSPNGSEAPYGYESQSDHEFDENHTVAVIEVSIEGGRKYSHIELISEAYSQHRDMMREITLRMLSESPVYDGYNTDYLPDDIIENEILLWMAVREIADSDIEEISMRAMKKDIDFWMF
ncbi:hypothetical protein DRQ25_07005, partial [Candidatus Fermentibacteria bacterium]